MSGMVVLAAASFLAVGVLIGAWWRRDRGGRPAGQASAPLPPDEGYHRLQDFAQSSSDWFWEMDADLLVSYVSERITEVTGHPIEYHIGKTRAELTEEDTASEKWQDHIRTLERREPFKDFRYSRIGPDGEIQHISTSGVPVFDDEGRFQGYRGSARDITVQHRIRQELIESQNLLESIFENVPVGLLIKDMNHIVEKGNRTYFNWYGLDGESVTGHRSDQIEGFQSADEVAYMNAQELEVLTDGRPLDRFVKRPFADGTVHDVSITKFPVYDRDGNITKVGSVSVDLTEQMRAREALQENELLLTSIINNLPVGLVAKDLTGRCIVVNDTFCDWYGLNREQIVGFRGDEMNQAFDDGEVIDDQEARVMATGEMASREVDRMFADGTSHHLMVNKYPFYDANGKVSGIVSISLDLTDQVEAQREITRQSSFLDSVIENIPNMIFVKEAEELRFTLLNQAGEELLGIPRDKFMGKNDFDFFPAEQAEFFVEKDRQVLAQSEPIDIAEEPLDTPTNDRRLLHTKKISIRDEDGTPRYLLGISEDITERKRIEKELAESLAAANRANRAKSEFLAHMSHELRTPLNSIIGFTEVMASGIVGEPNAKHVGYLENIGASAQHLLHMINDILDISRLEAGEMAPEETEFEVRDLVDDVIKLVGVLAADKHQTLHTDVPGDGLRLRADERMVRQILMNLISNASKFTAEHGEINVAAENDEDGGILIRVTDNGIGIDADDIPKVLEPFGQARSETVLTHDGTGLGLSISTRLAALHDATLDIESDVGQGTTVSVVFPPDRVVKAG